MWIWWTISCGCDCNKVRRKLNVIRAFIGNQCSVTKNGEEQKEVSILVIEWYY